MPLVGTASLFSRISAPSMMVLPAILSLPLLTMRASAFNWLASVILTFFPLTALFHAASSRKSSSVP